MSRVLCRKVRNFVGNPINVVSMLYFFFTSFVNSVTLLLKRPSYNKNIDFHRNLGFPQVSTKIWDFCRILEFLQKFGISTEI